MAENDTPHVVIGEPDEFGRIRLAWGDHFVVTLHMNWRALKAYQDEWGINSFASEAAAGLDDFNIETLAVLFAHAATVEGEEKPIGYDRIMSLGFPIAYARPALLISWAYAWRGGEAFEPDEETDAAKKMNPLGTSLRWLSRVLSGPASGGANSMTSHPTSPESS